MPVTNYNKLQQRCFNTLWSALPLSQPFVPQVEHQKGLSRFSPSWRQKAPWPLYCPSPRWSGGEWEEKGKIRGSG